jgi:hypothetical protein
MEVWIEGGLHLLTGRRRTAKGDVREDVLLGLFHASSSCNKDKEAQRMLADIYPPLHRKRLQPP